MSRSLQKIIFKVLDKKAKNSQVSLLSATNRMRARLQVKDYKSLLVVYKEIMLKRYGAKSWGGKEKIRDLGYNCNLSSVGFSEDIEFVAVWLAMHSEQINECIELNFNIQELVLEGDFKKAYKLVGEFQDQYGWSFWVLELLYFLMHKMQGTTGVRALTKNIKLESQRRIVGYAASMLADRVDDRHSIEAFLSRWREGISKSLNSDRSRHYYYFRALGKVTSYEVSFGHVLCNDFSNSLFDCYNSFLESISSLAANECGGINNALILRMIDKVESGGVQDFRLKKVRFLLTGNYYVSASKHDERYPRSTELAKMLYRHEFAEHQSDEDKEAIGAVGRRGVLELEQLSRIEKYAFSLRYLPVGLALNGYASHLIERDIFEANKQPWTSFLSSDIELEEFLNLPSAMLAIQLNELVNSDLECGFRETAKKMLSVLAGEHVSNVSDSLPPSILFWLGGRLLLLGREAECEASIEHLALSASYWKRQACKLKVRLICHQGKLREAVDLAYNLIMDNPACALEYPFREIFDSVGWKSFKEISPVKVAIVSHFTNESLKNADEDISYICKMACKKISEEFDRDAFFVRLDSPDIDEFLLFDHENTQRYDVRNALVILYEHVWIETNLTFLEFVTSREVMLERLDVLRLLVQINSSNEQFYASAIMDITLRDTMWAGLSHIEETRIFVNEAGITRWAEKELKSDFENWKQSYIYESESSLIKKMGEYFSAAPVESVEEFIDHELSEDYKLLLSIVERLKDKFLNDPVDGLLCYLSARIRHGTIKNTYLGPIDEAGLLAVKGELDSSVIEYVGVICDGHHRDIVSSAILNLSIGLIQIIDDALDNKIRLRGGKYPAGYIEIKHDNCYIDKVVSLVRQKPEFHQFLSTAYSMFWDLLWPSLRRLAVYFEGDVQNKTNDLFEVAIQKIESVGDDSKALSVALTRIKNFTCQKCQVAAGWFKVENHIKDRVFTLDETVSIAAKAVRNIYRRFNGEIVKDLGAASDISMSGVGMAAIVENLNTLFENCWKYSGLGESNYEISIKATFDVDNSILCLVVSNPLSDLRRAELSFDRMIEIKSKFQIGYNAESVAMEGDSGFPKIARFSRHLDRNICPVPLDIFVEDSSFKVVAYVPVYLRGDVYDVYNH